MTLYHGSNVEVREPKILKFNRGLDLGNGFYTTTNRDQAVSFVRYDFAFGPVANDDVYRTLYLYRAGEIDREETFKRLKVKELYNQLVFATPLALSFIRFRESEVFDV